MERLIDRLLAPVAGVVLAIELAITGIVGGRFRRAQAFAARLSRIRVPGGLRGWALLLAVGFWLPLVAVPAQRFWDFAEFYVAGRLVGTPAVLDVSAVVDLELRLGLQSVPFVYTPAFAWLYAPLSGLPYTLAAVLNLLAMFGLLLASVELGRKVCGVDRQTALLATLAWPPTTVAVITGQTSTLALLLVVVVSVAMLRGGRWELLAGVALAGLAYKPTLMLPLLGLLLLRCRWRALAAAAIGLAAVYLLSVGATGGDWNWMSAWLSSASYVVSIDTVNQWQSVSLVETLGGAAPAYLLGALLVLALLPSLRVRPLPEAMAVALVAGLVVSPHALVYDATLVLPAVAVLGRRAIPLYALAALIPVGSVLGFQPLVLGLVAWLVVEARLRRSEIGTTLRPTEEVATAAAG